MPVAQLSIWGVSTSLWLLICMSIALVLVFMFSMLVIRFYVDPDDSSAFSSIVTGLSLTLALLCCAAVPLDIYATAQHHENAETIRHAYYALYGLWAIWVVCVVPFVHFYIEEGYSDDAHDCGERLANACKYTVGFLLMITVLCVIGLAVRPGHVSKAGEMASEQWIQNLFDIQHEGHSALIFTVAVLLSVGLLPWLLYTAYGLAMLPLSLVRGKKSLQSELYEVQVQLRDVQAEVARLENKARKRKKEVAELSKLQKRERLLSRKSVALTKLSDKNCLMRCLSVLAPFRVLLGMALMVVSLLLASSMLMNLADKAAHSVCGADCGYVLTKPTYFNPTDELLTALSGYFPMDVVCLAAITLYVFACSLYGVTSIGLRVLCVPLYRIKRRATASQALLLMGAVMMFVIQVQSMELLTLAPQYTTFGDQTYSKLVVDSDSSSKTGSDGLEQEALPCRLDVMSKSCAMSQIAIFLNRITVSMPFFAVVYYGASWLFVGFFLIFFIYALTRGKSGNLALELDSDEEADQLELLVEGDDDL
eukprot:PLAT3072.1.p1 GENE.PLAT3072.1~~PLAT3072.1.p1  ORF type:complete len:536 (+),score=246.98 PLAT3072.1:26-1633(+)